MIIFINGPFGVGKSSVARALRRRLSGSAVFDPEPAGVLLQLLSTWFAAKGHRTDDFQDIAAWRQWVAIRLRVYHQLNAHTIIPMTFSNERYFADVLEVARSLEPLVHCFCLTAPLPVIEQRLRQRGARSQSKTGVWSFRRATECVDVFGSATWCGDFICTEKRDVVGVASEVLARVSGNKSRGGRYSSGCGPSPG